MRHLHPHPHHLLARRVSASAGPIEEEVELGNKVCLARAVPVQRAVEPVARVLGRVEGEFGGREERAVAHLGQQVETHAAGGGECGLGFRCYCYRCFSSLRFAVVLTLALHGARFGAVHGVKERPDLVGRAHGGLDLARGKVQLVCEIGQSRGHELGQGRVRRLWRGVRGAHGDHGADELGLQQRDAVDDGAAPVVAAEQDVGDLQLGAESLDVVGDSAVGVGRQRGCRGAVGAAVAEAVWRDDLQVQGCG